MQKKKLPFGIWYDKISSAIGFRKEMNNISRGESI
jgi:hypothetical protein